MKRTASIIKYSGNVERKEYLGKDASEIVKKICDEFDICESGLVNRDGRGQDWAGWTKIGEFNDDTVISVRVEKV